jgi:DNA-binding SARP family transcriptional activator
MTSAGAWGSRPTNADRVRGVAAVAILLVILVALPAAVAITVGWPLPRSVPRFNAIPARPDDMLLVRALAVAFWVFWTEFAVATAIEGTALARGTGLPRPLPFARHSQDLARRLLVTALLLSSSAGAVSRPLAVSIASVTIAPEAQDQRATAVAFEPVARQQDITSSALVMAASSTTTLLTGHERVYNVRPPVGRHHETLWEISDRYLRDPLRYPEIADLNRGREQPDGGRLVDDGDLIRPGWVLLMPADAVGLPPAPAELLEAAGWPARTHASDTEVAAPVVTAPRHGATDAVDDTCGSTAKAQPTAPDASDERLLIPEPGQPTPPQPPTGDTTTTGQMPPARDVDDADDPSRLVPVAEGLLAASVLACLTQLRRIQRRRRRTGATIPLPTGDAATRERELRTGERPEDAAFLDLALRTLGRAATAAGVEPPDLLAVNLTADQLDLWLSEPNAVALAPFTATDAFTWTLDRDTDLDPNARLANAVYPALVTIGYDDTGVVLVDVEALGLVALRGASDVVDGFLRAATIELATSCWADEREVVLAGLASVPPVPRNAVRTVDTLAEIRPLIDERATSTGLAVRDHGVGDVLRGRATPETTGHWTPLIVLADLPTNEDATADDPGLTPAVARRRSGVAVLATSAAAPQCRWTLDFSADGDVTIARLDRTVRAQTLTVEEFASIIDLLTLAQPEETTSQRPQLVVTEPDWNPRPSVDDDPREDGPVSHLHPVPDAEAELGRGPTDDPDMPEDGPLIRILGPIDVSAAGSDPRSHRRVTTEVLAYLALHPQGVQSTDLEAAIWPPHPGRREISKETRHSAISRARLWLGKAPDGSDYLPTVSNGTIRLDPRVRLDWHLFEQLCARARGCGQAGRDDLRRALDLVRGPAFADAPAGRYVWRADTGIDYRINDAIVDAAHRLAALCLDDGDYAAAREAARTGREIDPYREELWRDLLRAEHGLGGVDAVTTLIAEFHRLLDDDIEPYDSMEPETVAVIDELLPRRPAVRRQRAVEQC